MKGNVRWKNQWQATVRTDSGRGHNGGLAIRTMREWALYNIKMRVEGESPIHVSYFKDFERCDDKEGSDEWGFHAGDLAIMRGNQCTRERLDPNLQGGTN